MSGVRYGVTEHVNPTANSHKPLMTVICMSGDKMLGYCAVPQDLTILNDEEALEALFRKYKKYR